MAASAVRRRRIVMSGLATDSRRTSADAHTDACGDGNARRAYAVVPVAVSLALGAGDPWAESIVTRFPDVHAERPASKESVNTTLLAGGGWVVDVVVVDVVVVVAGGVTVPP